MKSKLWLIYMVAALLVAIGYGGMAYSQRTVNVTGMLTDDFTIETEEGKVYEVADDDVALEMFENVGNRATVTGTIIDTDDGPLFKVRSYKILEE